MTHPEVTQYQKKRPVAKLIEVKETLCLRDV